MHLLRLPDALLQKVGSCLTTSQDLNALLRTNHRLRSILTAQLQWRYGHKGPGGTHGALHNAALKGHDRQLRRLIKSGCLLESRGKNHMTALHCAAEAGTASTVTLLLNAGADITARDAWGKAALHFAAQSGCLTTVIILVRKGLDPDAADKCGNTALHYAATGGHRMIAGFLIDFGCDTNATGWMCRTPLHCAAIHGHHRVADELIRGGAKIDAESLDHGGHYTPFLAAAGQGQSVMIKLLAAAGADVNGRVAGLQGCELASTHLAAFGMHTSALKVLLELGVNPGLKNTAGMNALHCAAVGGDKATAGLLVRNFPELLESKDNNGRTPLMLAIGAKNEAVYELLIDSAADIAAVDDAGRTVFDWVESSQDDADEILSDAAYCTKRDKLFHLL